MFNQALSGCCNNGFHVHMCTHIHHKTQHTCTPQNLTHTYMHAQTHSISLPDVNYWNNNYSYSCNYHNLKINESFDKDLISDCFYF